MIIHTCHRFIARIIGSKPVPDWDEPAFPGSLAGLWFDINGLMGNACFRL
jgi:hypothetical protein